MNSVAQPDTREINSVELPAGYELMNYVIERKMGRGGFGLTYLASESVTGRSVVIKENFPLQCSMRNPYTLSIVPAGEENVEFYEWALTRFLDEAKTLVRLSHPGIVPVLTAFKALGTAYYVMPVVEGNEIHTVAPAPGVIDEAWLRPVLQKVLEALDYLHAQSVLHRDIKPSNILLRVDGTPLLIDFGTARSSDATHTLTRVGSPGFSPAEQFTARGKNGPWTDLYSLGATCYTLITGEAPQDSIERLDEDELPLLAENAALHQRFSVAFLATIDKALRMNRRDRWQSAQEWLAALTPTKVEKRPKSTGKREKTSTAKRPTAKQSTAKQSTAKQSTAKPSTAQPSTAQPSTANPATAKPSTAQPSTPKTRKKKDSFEDKYYSFLGLIGIILGGGLGVYFGVDIWGVFGGILGGVLGVCLGFIVCVFVGGFFLCMFSSND